MNSDRISAAARKYLERVKALPCGVCGQPGPSEAHHIKQGLHFVCIPVCADCHRGSRGIHGDRSVLRQIKCDEPDLLADVIELLSKERT